ncbi:MULTISPECIES: YchJ family metal-binding protein [Sulfurimonas]|uniref:YchJ family protein n=1 Tax=Sulfurimonas TaxID=202746 RepID=UPI0012651250|nr:YchJ family metal-binding protein [Sulfurimonas indica]
MTPKKLMISRYEAFVRKDWEYLARTSTSQSVDELKLMPDLEWLKLEVLHDYDNIVEFKAYYRENGKIGVLHEKSYFIEESGSWKYQDGELFNAKVERNEPCPCGSGKKFKKCCAI